MRIFVLYDFFRYYVCMFYIINSYCKNLFMLLKNSFFIIIESIGMVIKINKDNNKVKSLKMDYLLG